MKITHIIPSAFEYFNDIRERAFSWVEALGEHGFDVDVFTLQYDRPDTQVKEDVAIVAPSRKYESTGTVKTMIETITKSAPSKEAEIIHLHTPFLGGAGQIIKFIKSRPSARLVITHHRPVRFEDLISVYIYFYNSYYLPKLFALASAVLLIEPKESARREADKFAGATPIFLLGTDKKSNKNYPHPMAPVEVAENLIIMYNNLTRD